MSGVAKTCLSTMSPASAGALEVEKYNLILRCLVSIINGHCDSCGFYWVGSMVLCRSRGLQSCVLCLPHVLFQAKFDKSLFFVLQIRSRRAFVLGADRRSAPSTNAAPSTNSAHIPTALGQRVWGLPWAPDREYDGGVGPP